MDEKQIAAVITEASQTIEIFERLGKAAGLSSITLDMLKVMIVGQAAIEALARARNTPELCMDCRPAEPPPVCLACGKPIFAIRPVPVSLPHYPDPVDGASGSVSGPAPVPVCKARGLCTLSKGHPGNRHLDGFLVGDGQCGIEFVCDEPSGPGHGDWHGGLVPVCKAKRRCAWLKGHPSSRHSDDGEFLRGDSCGVLFVCDRPTDDHSPWHAGLEEAVANDL